MQDYELNDREKRAISALRRLAKTWPKTLWLFCGGQNGISVMRCGENGEHVTKSHGGIDQDYVVATVYGIDSDGGDW